MGWNTDEILQYKRSVEDHVDRLNAELSLLRTILATERDQFGKRETELKAELDRAYEKNGASLRAWIREKELKEKLEAKLSEQTLKLARYREALEKCERYGGRLSQQAAEQALSAEEGV